MADTPFGPGTVLAGRFTLDDLLDDSDGARFWRATDQTLARSVAVHVLAASDARASALLTAARTSALVSDGHFLRVLDAADEDGVVYVVNEWGSGVSLDRMLVEGPLPPRRAAWVVKEVAEAIATAHRNGIAHGRLLPENVMVTEAGSVKLIGFVVDAVLKSQAGRDQRRVTGGPPMSAHESDVVNLAALLYAALVGRWPGTEGSTVPAAPTEHGRPLRPRQVRAGVPRPLDAICERVLNAGPHTHALPIETAHEVYAALSDYIGDPTGTPQLEATTVFAADELAMAADDGPATEMHHATPRGPVTDTGELGATGAFPAPGSDHAGSDGVSDGVPDGGSDDAVAEQTQAGVPVFFDEDTGVGWTSATPSRGLRAEDGSGPETSGWGGDESTRRSPAPPPPLPDHPERPLFADGPPRAGTRTTDPAADPAGDTAGDTGSDTGSDTGTGSRTGWSPFAHHDAADTGSYARSTGAGNGRVPATWGPDPEDPPAHDDTGWQTGGWEDRPPGRSWLRLAAVVAAIIVIVVGAVFAFNLGRGSGTPSQAGTTGATGASSSPPQARHTALKIAGVTDFDPQGDPPEENPELAPLAIDGKPSTAWQTSTYYDPLEKLKSGVGLLVDLGHPRSVDSVKVALMGDGTSLQILAAPDAQAAPSSTDGLDEVASVRNAGTRADLGFKKPVTTQWLVVWLTSLPAAPNGFQGRIAEISVSS